MKNVKMDITCSMCEHKNTVVFNRPAVNQQAFFSLRCSGCDSDFEVIVKKKAGTAKGQIAYKLTPRTVSDKGHQAMLEKAKLEARALEVPK